jgi:hypothetical protein
MESHRQVTLQKRAKLHNYLCLLSLGPIWPLHSTSTFGGFAVHPFKKNAKTQLNFLTLPSTIVKDLKNAFVYGPADRDGKVEFPKTEDNKK